MIEIKDTALPETISGLPNICGSEDIISETMARRGPYYLNDPASTSAAPPKHSASPCTCISR